MVDIIRKFCILALVTLLFSLQSVGAVEVLKSGNNLDHAARLAADHGWVMGHTSVSDLSVEEKKKLCGVRFSDDHRFPDLVIHQTGDYPEYFNYHDLNGSDWMTPVKNQGICGSCWAFSAVGVVEAAINLAIGDPDYDVDLSEQELISCCDYCGDCGGGDPASGLFYIEDSSIVKEECFPYTSLNSNCTICDDPLRYNVTGVHLVTPYTTEAYKGALMEYGPLSVVMEVPEDWLYYKGGVYTPTWTTEEFGTANHAVVLCGWNDSGGYWIVKNSWGTRWGNDGYGYVAFGVLEGYRHTYAVSDPKFPSTDWQSPIDAVATSEFTPDYSAENAIDGDVGTHWIADLGDSSSWIQFDLGDTKHLSQLRIMVLWDEEVRILDDSENVLAELSITTTNEYIEISVDTDTRYVAIETVDGTGNCIEFQYCEATESDSYIEIMYSDGSTERINKEVSEVSVFIDGVETLKYRR